MSKKDDSRKACFIHIPKNAGMSIESVLHSAGHESVSELFGKEGGNLRGWNISAIVRNPYDRAVSVWAHGRQVADAPFEWPERFSDYIHMLPTKIWQTHARPQYSYIITKKGLATTFVGRFENMAEAYERICHYHGLETPPPLPHMNPSERKHWRDYYNYDLLQAINKIYWEDFSYFDYPML